jgi:hypothetical protein
MITKILIGVAVIVAIFLIVAALQPSEFRIVRSITISAPPSAAFAQVNDLHKWQEMSPYAKLDLAAKYSFEGPSAGTGASLAWAGNSKVGEGRMTITESRPNELVRMRLDFIKPFASTAVADFTFKPAGDQTEVSWSMAGRKIFITKAMCLIMSMDKMVGPQFEEGLANLKALSEASAKK